MAALPAARRVVIQPLHELRIELEKHEAVSIKLLNGTAEIFGHELTPNVEWPLGEEVRVAVYSWTGAEVELLGECSTEYIAEETPIPSHYNVHLALEQLRVACLPPPSFLPSDDPIRQQPPHLQPDETLGPRVLVIGESGSGKSTICKTLLNWAIRAGKARRDGDWTEYGAGRKVMFVNLDPADGAVTIPGTFSAVPINTLLPTTTPVHPFGTTHSTSLPPLHQQAPSASAWAPSPSLNTQAPMFGALSFWYGHSEWTKNDELANLLLGRLGDCVRRRIDTSGDEALWRGGVIVDTPADFAKKDRYSMITKCVREFEVNVLLVVGNERLHVEMSKLMSTNKTVTVIRVPKNGGATVLEPAYRRRLQASQIRSYFYGGPPLSLGPLTPHSISVPLRIITINRVGDESNVPLSALPIGHTRTIKDTQLVEIDLSEGGDGHPGEVMNKICALPQIQGSRKKKPKVVKETVAKAEDVETERASVGSAATEIKKESIADGVKKEEVGGEEGDSEKGPAETAPETETGKLDAKNGQEPATDVKPSIDAANDVAPAAAAEDEDEDEYEDVENHAEDPEIAGSPVVGFVHIANVDTERQKYTILSPVAGKLPRTRFLIGSLEWQDA